VTSSDTSGTNSLVGDGVKKLKYGADLMVIPLPWLAVGARTDVVQPTNLDSQQSFWVISPKIVFRTHYVTHEEVTLQYSHYSYGTGVAPQPPNARAPVTPGQPFTGHPPDENVFGAKATLWW
jgi:hypothetical protein